MTPSLVLTQYLTPSGNSSPAGITSGNDGNMWFTESISNNIAKLVLSTVPVPSLLTISPSFFSFTGEQGGTVPAPQSLTISSPSPTSFIAATQAPYWLSVTPSDFLTTNQTISVSVTQDSPSYVLSTGENSSVVTLSYGGVIQNVPVTFNVSAASNPISLTVLPPGGLIFSYLASAAGMPQAQMQQVVAGNPQSISVPITATASSTGNWLSVTPTSTTTPANLIVSAAPSGLSPAIYNGTITIAGGGVATGRAATLGVELVVQGTPLVQASTTGLTFTTQQGGAAPQAQIFTVTAPTPTSFTLTPGVVSGGWLSVSPSSGSTPTTVTVTVSPTGLGPGTYNGSISVNATGGPPLSLPVTFIVTGATSLSANPNIVKFAYAQGGSAPGSQSIQISSAGAGSVAFTATSNVSWLTVSPASGVIPGTLTVSVSVAQLGVGLYAGTILVTPASGSPLSIPVNLVITAPATLLPSPSTLAVTYSQGSKPPSQSVQIPSPASGSVSFTASSSASWLTVAPLSGSTPATLTVAISEGLAVGNYAAIVYVTVGGSVVASIVVTATVTAASSGPPTITTVVNAASFAAGAISPGQLISIVGTNLGPAVPAYLTLDRNGNVATSLSGVTVQVGGTLAPLIYASSTQINAVAPYEISGQPAVPVSVAYQGQSSNEFSVEAVPAAPGIFTQASSGAGPGAILNQDYSLNGPANPAKRGGTVTIFMTGEGQTSPPGIDGWVTMPTGSDPITPGPVLSVSATIAGQPALVQFAGEAPGIVSGVLQVNLQIPANAPTGNLAIVVSIGNINSQTGVTVSVQ
jgi:uncharacterized protein (TIGR03437 family)